MKALIAVGLLGILGCGSQANRLAGTSTSKAEYLEFIPAEELQPYKDALPVVQDADIQAILDDDMTMWYDEESMTFVYQDSVEFITGLRHNSVGYKVGSRNGHPISKLTRYFKQGSFRFPFATVAGTDDVSNIESKNFWAPPRDENGNVTPVAWWQTRRGVRGHWSWIHPVGTVFGEVLYQRANDNSLFVFEIRIRKRYIEGWDVDVFRPYATAREMAAKTKQLRPNWQQETETLRLINYLERDDNLVPATMQSQFYERLFPKVEGHLDVLPSTNDQPLIKSLLTAGPFVSVKGMAWKQNATAETYAPGSAGEFHIVPRGYKMGLIEVNEVSCNRCHQSASVQIGHLDEDLQLYGEIWGEDRIFTWHLFRENSHIYATWDDSDGSRFLNTNLRDAGLIAKGRPAADSTIYRSLPKQLEDAF